MRVLFTRIGRWYRLKNGQRILIHATFFCNQTGKRVTQSSVNQIIYVMALLDWDENHPQPAEYNEYYQGYIDLVSEQNVIQQLIQQGQNTYALIRHLSAEQAVHQYAKGKWSVKEV